MDYKKEQAKSTTAPQSVEGLISKKGDGMQVIEEQQFVEIQQALANDPNLQLTPLKDSPYRFIFYGITYLLSTPTEFQRDAASGLSVRPFLQEAGIIGDKALNNCEAFVNKVMNGIPNMRPAIAAFGERLLTTQVGAAAYSPFPCPLRIEALGFMKKMVELAEDPQTGSPGITKR